MVLLRLEDFIGQKKLKKNLKVYIDSARARHQVLDHVLLYGPPGLGKTTLARVIAHELGVGFRGTSGPLFTKAGDLAAILTNLEPMDVLFIDEIHRMSSAVEEVLYAAMESFSLDVLIGSGPGARSIKVDLSPFTLVAATTRPGMLTKPLRDRFGIGASLDFYTEDELMLICEAAAQEIEMVIDRSGYRAIACRSRGTPRIAKHLLMRVRDYMIAEGLQDVESILGYLDVDRWGLDAMDRHYLSILGERYGGGPVGLETLSAALSREKDMLEDMIEPFLLRSGMIKKTPKGRCLTTVGWSLLQEAGEV